MKIFLMILFLAAAAACVKGAMYFDKRRREYSEKTKAYSANVKKYFVTGRKFQGTVLKSVKGKKPAIILQFRDEEQKKTVVQRYEPMSGRYKKGDSVTLYYNEETDTVTVEGDEPFSHDELKNGEMFLVCVIGAAVCAAAAVYVMLIIS